MARSTSFAELVILVARLCDPATGCPWDREQDHRTLQPYLLEETYEMLRVWRRAERSPHGPTCRHVTADRPPTWIEDEKTMNRRIRRTQGAPLRPLTWEKESEKLLALHARPSRGVDPELAVRKAIAALTAKEEGVSSR